MMSWRSITFKQFCVIRMVFIINSFKRIFDLKKVVVASSKIITIWKEPYNLTI